VSQYFLEAELANVGKLELASGKSTSIDGVTFRVQSANETVEKQKYIPNVSLADDKVDVTYTSVKVHQLPGKKGGPGIFFELNLTFDEAKFKTEFPQDSSKPYLGSNSNIKSGNEAKDCAASYTLTSNRPIKFCKEAAILRTSFVRGYLGHIPTKPNLTK
jgi:hypothetical protein